MRHIRFLLITATVGVLLGSCQPKNEADTDLIPVKTNEGGWIFIDSEGEVVIKPVQQIYEASFFYEGRSRVEVADETSQTLSRPLAFINKKGEFINGKKYKYATIFNDGIAWVVEENGFPTAITPTGETLFALKACERVGIFSEGLAPVCFIEDGIRVWGYIDNKGKTAIHPAFVDCSGFSGGLAPAVKDEAVGWGYINPKGEFVIQPQFSGANCFDDNGLAVVSIGDRDKKYGLIDRKGKYVVSPQYDQIKPDGDTYIVKSSGVYGWIDRKGKIIINPQFKGTFYFRKANVTGVSIDDKKWGIIDREGKYVLNPQYDAIGSFIGDIAPFVMSGKVGFIDREGKIVINPQYTDVPSDYMGTVKTYMLNDDRLFVSTDYFDVEAVTTNLLKNSDSGSFRGISGNTTFGQIKESYGDLSYFSSSSRKSSETVDLSNGVSIAQIIFEFPEELSKSSYNYYDNTYETEENTAARVTCVKYRLELDYKAADKPTNIMQGIADAIVKKYGSDSAIDQANSESTIHTSSMEFNIRKYGSAIWIEVTFK